MTGKQPTYCMIFEAVGPYSAIGRVAVNNIRVAQEAGYKITVVAKRLDESLRDEVEWLPLFVPPKFFYLKWVTAAHYMRAAIGDRKFDIVHAHQPQAAYMSDVFQCHFLTRIAAEFNCLQAVDSPMGAFQRLQEQGVLRAEDACYKAWNPKTRMLYVSEMILQQFRRLYGTPPEDMVLSNAAMAMNIPTPEERISARKQMLGDRWDYPGPVLGYIGGRTERKGYKQLIASLEGESDVMLLMGGLNAEGFEAPSLGGRFKSMGLTDEMKTFYAACDVLAVPSYFDPCPLVVFEGASRGLPVIATEGVGNLPELLKHRCGAAWSFGTPITPIVHDLLARRAECHQGAAVMTDELSMENWRAKLRQVYEDVLDEKGRTAGKTKI